MKRWFFVAVVMLAVLQPLSVSAVSTSARAAAVLCGDTGEILYVQNAEMRLPMASTTKIMTGLLLCESGDLSREITVTREMVAVEGSSMGLLPGDRVTLHDLLYGLMLASGNDAANTAAFTVSGSVERFAVLMNDRAKRLGLKNTHFVTPSGLDADGHYTSAYDLAQIAREALKNEDLKKAVSSESAVLHYGNPPYRRALTNHNKLLKSYDGLIGVKTGFTKKSGRCLVTAARRDGKYVIAVTLSDPNDWEDHRALLDYGFSKLSAVTCAPPNEQVEIPTADGERNALTVSVPVASFSTANKDSVTCKVSLPPFVYAPVSAGETVGTVCYGCGEETVAQKPIVAKTAIPAKKPSKAVLFLRNLQNIIACIT